VAADALQQLLSKEQVRTVTLLLCWCYSSVISWLVAVGSRGGQGSGVRGDRCAAAAAVKRAGADRSLAVILLVLMISEGFSLGLCPDCVNWPGTNSLMYMLSLCKFLFMSSCRFQQLWKRWC
jgi:hypothetical protein